MPTRSEMFKALRDDYPNVYVDHINLLLDLYEKDHSFVERMCKDLRQKEGKKGTPEIKTQMTQTEIDRLFKIFKEQEADILSASKAELITTDGMSEEEIAQYIKPAKVDAVTEKKIEDINSEPHAEHKASEELNKCIAVDV